MDSLYYLLYFFIFILVGDKMKNKIIKICKDIEKNYKVKIIFAVESGSRSWGMSSKNSDYDVRFVFCRKREDYLKLSRPKEIIAVCEHMPEIDVLGFDIYKFCKMLSTSNPTCIEWLLSEITYYGKIPDVLKKYIIKNHRKIALFHHYKSMCKQNYYKYLNSKRLVTYKKYLYCMRGLVNSLWVKHTEELPPINFNDTLKIFESEYMKQFFDSYMNEKLQRIIALKKKGKEEDIIQNIVKLDRCIGNFLKTENWEHKETKELKTEKLDKYIVSVV